MKFFTQYHFHDREYACPGSPIKELFAPFYDELGRMRLEKTGEENLYDYIQSHAESVNINTLLKRYAQGDVSALSRCQGMYGDFSQFPRSYAEVLNAVNAARDYFLTLPLEVRAKYGYDVNQFLASLTPESFLKGSSPQQQPEAEKVIEKEVPSDAS